VTDVVQPAASDPGSALLVEQRDVVPEQVDGERVEGDLPHFCIGFAIGVLWSALNDDTCGTDGQRAVVEVERGTVDPGKLGAAHAGRGSEHPQSREPVRQCKSQPCGQFVEGSRASADGRRTSPA
jgi:hypothetical protein